MIGLSKIMIKVILIIILISGCASKGLGIDGKQASEELSKVKIELADKNKTSEGIEHIMRLKNGSSFAIKNITLFISYPYNNGNNGHKVNVNKIEAAGLKKVIPSGEEIIFKVYMPAEYFNGNNLDLDRFYIEMKGYFNDVNDKNRFMVSGDIEAINFKEK